MTSQYPKSEAKPETKPGTSESRSRDADKGIADKASEAVRSATDQASELAERAMAQGREVSAMAQKAPGAVRDAVDTSLKQQPMATLAVAGALGFLLGALWKS